MMLLSGEGREGAHRLYEKLGFKAGIEKGLSSSRPRPWQPGRSRVISPLSEHRMRRKETPTKGRHHEKPPEGGFS